MNISILKRIGLAAALTLSAQARTEDIDLFLGIPASAADAPNVLIVLDNTANWNTPFTAEMTGLSNIFNGLPSGLINVGLMMFTETGGGNSNTDGGYVRAAIRLMEDSSGSGSNSRQKYGSLITGLDVGDDKSNGGKAGLAMYEAHQYFAEAAPHGGNNKKKTDYTSNTYNWKGCCTYSKPVWALPGNALSSISDTSYNGPIDPTLCAKNYIIFISNGPTQDNNNDIGTSNSALESLQTGASTQISISPAGSAKNPADEWARYMKQSNMDITTFAIDIITSTTGQTAGWSALMESMADVSGGEYFTSGTGTDLEGILDNIFQKILAVNSVFASVALPAASNAQSTFLNRVYIGQFRPDEDGNPRWPGNLKQYKLGLDNTEVKVLDANNDSIIEPSTGFIKECTQSFWTPGTADNYWSFDPKGACSDATKPSNTPDGPIVEKGGQAYTVRAATNSTSRTVYTCSSTIGSCGNTSTLQLFNNGNAAITDALLDPNNPMTSAERTTLIDWGRGKDLDDEDDDGNTTEIRPSVHGDIVHSRPVAVNYGTDGSPEVVVFYGGNDGMLRAINGNRTTTHHSIDAGYELWSFMPPEFYSDIKRLRDNSVTVNVPATGIGAGTGGAAKGYGMDGSITAFEGPIGGSDKVYIYANMRRAARTLYAFDVTTPTAPTMLWKLGCPNMNNNTGCTGAPSYAGNNFDKIGQTWSTPNVIYATGYGSGASPMLIMGGGYDDCEDNDNNSTQNHNCTSSDSGNVIYVLDAVTGELLKTFATDRAVVGEIRTVTMAENSKLASYAYAADTGGNVYRISAGIAPTSATDTGSPAPIGSVAPTSWVISKIASLGCTGKSDSTCNAPRKFLFGPDIVRIPLTNKLGILLGSGDREKPLVSYGAANAVQNYFFSFIDQPSIASSWMDVSGDCNNDQICLDKLTTVATGNAFDPNTPVGTHGYKLSMASGEQVVSGALTIADIANFSTHIPADPIEYSDPNSPDFCKNNLGTATTYNVSYKDADGDTVNIIGGGLVPTPVAGKVILDDGTVVPFCIGCGGDNSAIGGSSVGSGVTWIQPYGRVYWNIQQ